MRLSMGSDSEAVGAQDGEGERRAWKNLVWDRIVSKHNFSVTHFYSSDRLRKTT